MSIKSALIAVVFKLKGCVIKTDTSGFYRELRKCAIMQWKGEKLSKSCIKNNVSECSFNGMRYYVFKPSKLSAQTNIIYTHGCYYMNRHHKMQEIFAAVLAKECNANVYFPIYPKLPSGTAIKCYAYLQDFYSFLAANGKIIIIGDSSGGALALALGCQNKSDTKAIFAISPWLDINMSNPKNIKKQKTDNFLSLGKLKHIARLWCCGIDYNNVKVSPRFGDYSGLLVHLYSGENEIFCPDIREFYEKNKSLGNNIHYKEGKNQPHDYILMPTIEGKIVIADIINCINKITKDTV